MSYYQRNKERIKKTSSARQKATYKSKKEVVVLGSVSFTTKKAMRLHFQQMLRSHSVGDELDPIELEQFKALADRHPSRMCDPPAISGVHIGNGYLGTINFVLDFEDGTEECISYIKCVNAKPKKKYVRDRVQTCARLVVADQIYAFRDATPLVCSVTGEELKRDDSHVDHDFNILTFQTILDGWLTANAWNYEDIKIIKCGVTEMNTFSPKFRRSWQSWHMKHATLRMIKKSINLSGKETS